MPSPNERRRNNVKAGVFMLIAIAAAMAVVISLSDVGSWFEPEPSRYSVSFSVRTGVRSLKTGSDVRVGGLTKGEVEGVELITRERKTSDDRVILEDLVRVDFTLEPDVQLYEGTLIMIAGPLIGAEAWLSIVDVAKPSSSADRVPLDPNEMIAGYAGPGLLQAVLGPDAAEVAANITEASRFVGRLNREYDEEIEPIFRNVRDTSTDVRTMMGELRSERFPAWSDRIDAILGWTADATASLDEIMSEGNGLLTDSRDILDENRASIRNTTANIEAGSEDVREITGRVREETIDKVTQVIDQANETLSEATDVLDRFNEDYDLWAVEIGDAMANANLTAQQLKLAAIEVRRNPWKLLYRPTTDELQHELLYEAARSFAMAVTDLRAATTSVNRMLENHGEELAKDEELMRRVKDHLLNPLTDYEKAQQRLFEILKSEQ